MAYTTNERTGRASVNKLDPSRLDWVLTLGDEVHTLGRSVNRERDQQQSVSKRRAGRAGDCRAVASALCNILVAMGEANDLLVSGRLACAEP